MYDAMQAETITITGHDGDDIEAYLARPLGPGPYGSVVVIHHMPGFDAGTKEIVRTFAVNGYNALCPNLHYRDAPGASPDDAAAASRNNGGVPDDRLIGDVAGAARHLRGLTSSNGKVGVIGYCSGGRQSFLAATAVDLQAAVDCYGAFVAAKPGPDFPFPFSVEPVLDRAGDLRCPVLGLFGALDKFPSTDEVAQIESELTRLNKPHEFHVYENATHAFFSTNRPSYNVDAANAGWERIWDFYGRLLAS
ncbi:dienelactone hydrolase family protein [Fodinicola acaciae]|uniref:dienelactone hydrolase family protein n=1 Tax=Fodinicola acaciae TaxID=2681555 RepID=UPI0013D41D6A|nr:dienelactone hydrolase family protein [Fodinicola acaciae]